MKYTFTLRWPAVVSAILILLLAPSFVRGMKIIHLSDFPSQNKYIDSVRFKLLAPRDHDFYRDDTRRKIKGLLPNEKSALSYRLWMQKKPAPLVIIIPGLGGNDAATVPTGLAEQLYNSGCSVVIISNPFNWEFAKNASRKITPGYPPQDAQDIYRALIKIIEDIHQKYGDKKITETILAGYSLGAINTLFIALLDSYEHDINFSRYVALNPPVNLLYGMIKLDEMYAIWHTWPKDKLISAKNRAVSFYDGLRSGKVAPQKPLPFTAEEAQFAIGFVFRTSLGELIKAINQRHDFGIIKAKQSAFSREAFEKEVEGYGYLKYVDTFVRAAYSNTLYGDTFDLRQLNRTGSLPALQKMLSTHPHIRIIHTTNDFLLTNNDRQWLNTVMGERITFFDAGGHLGYFSSPQAMEYIVETIKGEEIAAEPSIRYTPAHVQDDIPIAPAIEKPEAEKKRAPKKQSAQKTQKPHTKSSAKSMPQIDDFPETVDTIPTSETTQKDDEVTTFNIETEDITVIHAPPSSSEEERESEKEPRVTPAEESEESEESMSPFSIDTSPDTEKKEPFPKRNDINLEPPAGASQK